MINALNSIPKRRLSFKVNAVIVANKITEELRP